MRLVTNTLIELLTRKKIQHAPAINSRQIRVNIRVYYYSDGIKRRRSLTRRQDRLPIMLTGKENLVRTQPLSLEPPTKTMISRWSKSSRRIRFNTRHQSARRVLLSRKQSPKISTWTMTSRWSKCSTSVGFKTRHRSARRVPLSNPLCALRILKDLMKDTTTKESQLRLLDCLQAIAHEHLGWKMKPSKKIVKAVHRSTCHVLSMIDRPSDHQTALLRRIFFRLWRHSVHKDFYLLWKALTNKSVSLSTKSKMHTMHRLVSIGKVEDAFSMLHSIDQEDISSNLIQSICVRILRYKLEMEDLYGSRSKMLARMLELGVRPNRQLYNVIILNAMEAGDWETGWRCHQIALAYGLKSDEYTYTILLKSARDRDSVEDLRRSAIKDGIDVNTPRVASEFFIATFFCVRYRWTFADLLSHYQEFFDAQPLVDLEIIEPSAITHRSEYYRTELDFKPIPLGIMIFFYLRENSDNHFVSRIYQNYCRLVRQGHSAIRWLAETTYISNGFLMAFGQNRNTLHLCISVLEDMINPIRFQNQEAPSSTSLNIHPPCIRSWSILMASFLRHNQINAAEKVLAMMRAHKVWPNNVTWNILIEGYCHQNDPDGAAWRLRCMEEDGFERDERTMGALAKIKDRGKLIEALERAHSGEDVARERGTEV